MEAKEQRRKKQLALIEARNGLHRHQVAQVIHLNNNNMNNGEADKAASPAPSPGNFKAVALKEDQQEVEAVSQPKLVAHVSGSSNNNNNYYNDDVVSSKNKQNMRDLLSKGSSLSASPSQSFEFLVSPKGSATRSQSMEPVILSVTTV